MPLTSAAMPSGAWRPGRRNVPRSVIRFTVARPMPGSALSTPSMRPTHAAQLMPLIESSARCMLEASRASSTASPAGGGPHPAHGFAGGGRRRRGSPAAPSSAWPPPARQRSLARSGRRAARPHMFVRVAQGACRSWRQSTSWSVICWVNRYSSCTASCLCEPPASGRGTMGSEHGARSNCSNRVWRPVLRRCCDTFQRRRRARQPSMTTSSWRYTCSTAPCCGVRRAPPPDRPRSFYA